MADGPHMLIVEARFYQEIADDLCYGAIAAIEAAGGTYDRIEVPGAFEIPAAIQFAIESKTSHYDGYVGLGCVIRGETTHYDYVCSESARGMQDLALKYSAALGFGILTCENRDQANARARVSEGNKGGVVANAALRMVELKKHFGIS